MGKLNIIYNKNMDPYVSLFKKKSDLEASWFIYVLFGFKLVSVCSFREKGGDDIES